MVEKNDKENVPNSFQKKTCWWALTGVALTIIAILVVALMWLFGIAFDYLQQVLLPVVIAGIVAYILDPIVSLLTRLKIKRVFAVIAVIVAFLGVVVLGFFIVIPPIAQQTNDIMENREKIMASGVKTFDAYLKKPFVQKLVNDFYTSSLDHRVTGHGGSKENWLKNAINAFNNGESWNDQVQAHEQQIKLYKALKENSDNNQVDYDKDNKLATFISDGVKLKVVNDGGMSPEQESKIKLVAALENNSSVYGAYLTNWLSSGTAILSGVLGWIVGIALFFMFVFVFLKDSDEIAEKWTSFLPLRASDFKEEVVGTLTDINGYLIAFFRGQMIVSLIDGTLIGVCLWILGMPYAFIIGAAVGLLGIVPYVGIISVYIPTLLLSWFVWYDWQHLVWVSAIFLACNQFDSWLIQPKIVGNAVGLHEMTVIFSVIFWSFVFGGVVGALLAVPLTAAIKVIFQRYIWDSLNQPEKLAKATKSSS